MKILVTGSDGFIGSLVCRELKRLSHEIIEFKGEISNSHDLLRYFEGGAKFDRILHLAGMSAVGDCEKDPEKAFQVNSVGTFLLVELIKKLCPEVPLVFASSAQVYATFAGIDASTIISEESKVDPSANTYARTKWIAEEYIRSRLSDPGNSYTILRIFNHSHKSQRPDFFMPSIYQQIQSSSVSGVAKLTVGNVDVYRDIGAVQDLVAAIATVILKTERNQRIYNVCSGQAKSLRTIVMAMAERMGVRVELTVDPSRIRANEPTKILGSCANLEKDTGWKPQDGCNEDKLVKAFLLDFK